ncbi:MAG: hypothetical protein ACYDBJ_16810 [Aggregatilineales bacterium]
MDTQRIADLTISDFKTLIRETLYEVLNEINWDNFDPDEGLEFKPEVAEYLREGLRTNRRGTPSADVIRELGLEAWMPIASNTPTEPKQT